MSARLTWRGEPILIFSVTEKENSNALDNHTVSKWHHNVIALRLPPRAIFSHYLPSSFQIPRLAVRLVGGYKIVKKKTKKTKNKIIIVISRAGTFELNQISMQKNPNVNVFKHYCFNILWQLLDNFFLMFHRFNYITPAILHINVCLQVLESTTACEKKVV